MVKTNDIKSIPLILSVIWTFCNSNIVGMAHCANWLIVASALLISFLASVTCPCMEPLILLSIALLDNPSSQSSISVKAALVQVCTLPLWKTNLSPLTWPKNLISRTDWLSLSTLSSTWPKQSFKTLESVALSPLRVFSFYIFAFMDPAVAKLVVNAVRALTIFARAADSPVPEMYKT